MDNLGTLRHIRTAELELMRSWRNAPEVRANMYTRHEISLEEHLAWWEKTSQRDDQTYFMYEHEGSPRGIVGITAIDRVNSNCSWAFYAAPHAPRGTGSRMEFLALEHVFGQLKLHKLHCEVLAFNEPVIKLHQKFGFNVEGVFKEHHLNGTAYVDIFRLGLLDREWASQRDVILQKLTRMTKG